MKFVDKLQLLIKTTNITLFLMISLFYGAFMGGMRFLIDAESPKSDALVTGLASAAGYMLVFCVVIFMMFFTGVARVYVSIGMLRKNVLYFWSLLIVLVTGIYTLLAVVISGLIFIGDTGLLPVIMGINLNHSTPMTWLIALGILILFIVAGFTFASALGMIGTIYGGYVGSGVAILVTSLTLYILPYYIHYFEHPVMLKIVPAVCVGLIIVSIGVVVKLMNRIEVAK